VLLLDTNVVSELRKVHSGKTDRAFIQWESQVDASELYLSSATIHEMEFGVLLLEKKDPRQGKILRDWLDQNVLTTFEGRILPIDVAVARRSGYLQSIETRPNMDALIAATAYVHDMPVVTRNVAHFKHMGVRLINPWSTPTGS
jgi:predicted nucleic acid-binding protein